MKLIKRNIKNNGFTLIELIVVVSIILILSGFLVPKVLGYQTKAKNAKAVNTARQIFDATMADYTEEEGTLTGSKVSTAITEVSDAIIATSGGVVVATATAATEATATVTFASDTKTYSVVVTPNENKFVVNLMTGTDAGTPNAIYSNK